MTAFYFDVGGVLIPDELSPNNALNVFRQLGKRYSFSPEVAHATYTRLQPSLDALGIDEMSFEQDWLGMHPVDGDVISVIERLLERGHTVGLATNFCRRLLDLLITNPSGLSRVVVCCSSDIGLANLPWNSSSARPRSSAAMRSSSLTIAA